MAGLSVSGNCRSDGERFALNISPRGAGGGSDARLVLSESKSLTLGRVFVKGQGLAERLADPAEVGTLLVAAAKAGSP